MRATSGTAMSLLVALASAGASAGAAPPAAAAIGAGAPAPAQAAGGEGAARPEGERAAGTGAQAARRAPERVTFAEAVRRARVQAVTSVLSAEEVRRAQALLGQARSASLPLLTAQTSYTRLDSDRVANGVVLADRDQLAAAGVAQLPLVAPSRWVSWSHASEQVGVSRASDLDVQRTAAITAARAYLAILAQRRLVDVSRSARTIAQARYDFAHARRVGGIGNAVDELRAEQQLATGEAQLESAGVGLLTAQESLGVVTASSGPLDAAEEPRFDPRPAADAAAAAEAVRPDVRAARARVDLAARVARDSWTDWLPTLLATGQVFYQAPPTTLAPRTGWQIQFVLSLPIFEGGLRAAQREERGALTREARAALDGVTRQARSEVRLGLEQVARLEAALAQARRAAERAATVLKLTIESYRAGNTTDLDVSTAQQQSRDADTAAVVAEDAVRQSRLDLLSALGQFP